MAIITENVNDNPMQQLILADGYTSEALSFPKESVVVDFCTCDYECEYVNYVFADPSTTDDYKNDSSSFLISLSSTSAVLEITIVKDGIPIVINNNLYGEYFPKGTFTNTPNQVNYVGFIASWKKIIDTLGTGTYYFQFKETVFNREFITKTFNFQLTTFSDVKADKTIRFRFVQNGLIEDGLDYKGLNWITEIRIKGKFRYLKPTLVFNNYPNSKRTIKQIQDKSIKNFEIETYFIPEEVGDVFTENGVISNDTLVTNYDLFAYKKNTIDFNMIFTEVSDFKGNYNVNSMGSFTFTLQEITQDTVKRNV